MLTTFLLAYAMMAVAHAAAVPAGEVKAISIQDDNNYLVQSVPLCPSGWTQYHDRCFLYNPTAMTWANAEKNCQAQGGNLASVFNSVEYHFIQGMILKQTQAYPNAWLGGSDAQQEGTWLWSDGSHFTYTNWCPGEPYNYDGWQHCLVMNYDSQRCWDDRYCNDTYPFVCAKLTGSFLG